MADAWKNYTDLVTDETGLLGCWPPDRPLALGDIVRMEAARSPVRQQNLSDLGVEVAVRKGKQRSNLGVSSGAGIEIDTGVEASGPVHPGVSAGAALKVTFSRANAVLMRAEACRVDQFERLEEIRQEIIERSAKGKWEEGWLVISEVAVATRLLVLVSKAGGASVELGASAGIEAKPASLAKAEGWVKLTRRSEDVYTTDTEKPTTPLYRALRVKRSTLSKKTKVVQADRRGRARSAEEFDVVEYRY